MKFLFCMILLVLTATSVRADEQSQSLIGEVNCRVVNPDPRENERITWSGTCKDGYADGVGVLQWYINDKTVSRFDGHLEHGLPNGVGEYLYIDKSRYEGEFLEGKKNGQGTLISPFGDKISGKFENNNPVGVIDIKFKNGAAYSGELNINQQADGKGKLTYNDGASYTGYFKNGRRNGEGNMTYNDGVRYVGTFVNNKREGRGVCTYVDGGIYDGDWKDDMRDGDGYIKYSDGSQYEGDFKKNDRAGRGVMLYLDGSRYEGGWKAGQRDGVGSETYSLGGRYDGEWFNGKFHGKGTFVYANGRRVEGEFRNGKKLEISNDSIQSADIYALSQGDFAAKTRDLLTVTIKDVPFDKSYEQLTLKHKMVVKSLYPLMDENDEPPYPINGTKKIYDSLKNAQLNLLAADITDNGNLSMHVYVDSEGNPESVKIFSSLSAEITQVASIVVMKEKYKPGKCAGIPCAMIFPFAIKFSPK